MSKTRNNVPNAGTQALTALSNLAQQIVSHHQAAVAALAACAEHAMAAGDLLIKAQQQVAHGQWGEWIERNCKISVRTARVYMQLADNRAEIESKRQSSADLSIAGALKLISGPPKPKAQRVAVSPLPKAAESAPKKAGTGGDLWSLWDRTSREERQRFLEAVGLQEILDHIPATWVRTVEQIVRPSDWEPCVPADWRDGNNLEIPARLKRNPEKVH